MDPCPSRGKDELFGANYVLIHTDINHLQRWQLHHHQTMATSQQKRMHVVKAQRLCVTLDSQRNTVRKISLHTQELKWFRGRFGLTCHRAGQKVPPEAQQEDYSRNHGGGELPRDSFRICSVWAEHACQLSTSNDKEGTFLNF